MPPEMRWFCTGCGRTFASRMGGERHRAYHDRLKAARRRAVNMGCPMSGRVRRDGKYKIIDLRVDSSQRAFR